MPDFCEDLTTRRLAGVLNQCKLENSFFCDVLFREQITFDTEAIQWDRVYNDHTMAPLVSPCTQAPLMGGMDSTDSVIFKPAYIKAKSQVGYCDPLPRQPGERCWGDLTERERFQLHLARTLQRHDESIKRREENMSARALIDAMLEMKSETYPSTIVDYRRHDDLDYDSGLDLTSCDFKDVMDALQEAYNKVWCHSNALVTDLIMTRTLAQKLRGIFAKDADMRHCCQGRT